AAAAACQCAAQHQAGQQQGNTLFHDWLFSFFCRSFFWYKNILRRLCKIQKTRFVKSMLSAKPCVKCAKKDGETRVSPSFSQILIVFVPCTEPENGLL